MSKESDRILFSEQIQHQFILIDDGSLDGSWSEMQRLAEDLSKLSGKAFTGFTTVIILILGIGSCIMISLGIIGIYISKIYDEVKGRPRYILSAQRKSQVRGFRRRIQ